MDSCDHVIPEATPLCDHLLSHHVSSESEVITPATLVISIASDSDSIASHSANNAFIDLLNHEPALQIYADKLTKVCGLVIYIQHYGSGCHYKLH